VTARTGGLALALFCLAATTSAAPVIREVRDDTGLTVTVSSAPCRIVSLAPGTTAMLYAAGAGGCLIGTIAHSDEPAEAAKVPVVGDAETLDFEQLLALRPTVVVVAVDVVQRVRIDRIRSLGIPVYQVHVTRLAGMPGSLRRLGALAGTAAQADRAAAALDADLGALRAKYHARAPLRVLYQIWDRPIYTIGGKHVINDALQLCGAVNIFADLETAAPAVTREAALARDPELILASAPPASADAWLAEWRRFPSIAAVRNGHLVSYTDERIDRMGPSVIAATANLCEVVDRGRARGSSAQPGARTPR
jgi:iron complex transport system substrate-binding protein